MHAFRARLCFLQIGHRRGHLPLRHPGRPGWTLAPLARACSPTRRATKFFHAAGRATCSSSPRRGCGCRGCSTPTARRRCSAGRRWGWRTSARERLGVSCPRSTSSRTSRCGPLPAGMRALHRRRRAVPVRARPAGARSACVAADILEEVLLDCERHVRRGGGPPGRWRRLQAEVAAQRPSAGAAGACSSRRAPRLHALRLEWAEAAERAHGADALQHGDPGRWCAAAEGPAGAVARARACAGAVVREHGDEVLPCSRDSARQGRPARASGPGGAGRATPAGASARRRSRRSARRGRPSAKVTPRVVLPNPLVERSPRSRRRTLEALARVPYLGEKRVRLYGEALLKLLADA